MDYSAGNQALATDAPDKRPLDNLAIAVNRINTAQVRLSRFLDRWHGDSPPSPPAGGEAQTVTTPHSVNLDRLFAAIDRLETRIDTLDQIG